MLDLPPSQRVHTEYARNLIRMKSRQLLRRPEFWRDDRHDIEQDLWLHLLSRSAHFDPSRGSVNGFIACVVRTAVANLVRQHKRQLQSPDSGAQSLEGDTASDERRAIPLRVTITPADLARRTGGTSRAAVQQRTDSKAFSRAYRSLTSRQRQICSRLLEGRPEAIFFECEPGLNHLEVFKIPTYTWDDFLAACKLVAQGNHSFKTIVIDTIDNAFKFCSEHVCSKHNIEYEGDMGHGKGWALVKNEWHRVLTRLASLPYGLILISHAVDELLDQNLEVTKRTREEFTNVYFNRRLQIVGAGNTTPPPLEQSHGDIPF